MKSKLLLSVLACPLCVGLGPAYSQDWRTGDLGLKAAVAETLTPPTFNRAGLSYRPAFNVTVRFKGIGDVPAQTDPGPLNGSITDRVYDDGYNRADISPSDGLTWNWGYRDASQITPDGFLLLSSSAALPDGSSTLRDSGPQHGLELSYRRQLLARPRLRGGVEGGFGLTHVSVTDGARVSSSVRKLIDAYDLGGIIPPQAPPPAWAYEGTFFGPGALIRDTPSDRRQVLVPGTAQTTGRRKVEAWVYGLRLGPYVEAPVAPYLTFSLGGGLALAVADSHFQYAHLTQMPGFEPVAATGQASGTEARVGGYLSAGFAWSVARGIELFAGAQYQKLGRMRQNVGAAEAEIDLRNPLFLCVGAGFRF